MFVCAVLLVSPWPELAETLAIRYGITTVVIGHLWEKEFDFTAILQVTEGLLPALGGFPHGLCRPRQGESSHGLNCVCAVLLETSRLVLLGSLAVLYRMVTMGFAHNWEKGYGFIAVLHNDGGPVASMGALPHGLCRPRQ